MRATSTPSLSSPARSAAPARWLLALTLGLGAVVAGCTPTAGGAADAGCRSEADCLDGAFCFVPLDLVDGLVCTGIERGECAVLERLQCGCYLGRNPTHAIDGDAHVYCTLFPDAAADAGGPGADAGADAGPADR